jgi:dihydrofolate reductase
MTLVLVAAVARNGVIGHKGDLPWRMPGDLKRFKALTLGKPMVMGRRTFVSIGRPLPGRTTIVVTRDRGFAAPGVLVAASLPAALAAAAGEAARRGTDEIICAGGGELYAALIGTADRLELTLIDAEPAGDAFFPALPPHLVEVARTPLPRDPRDDHAAIAVSYRRTEPVSFAAEGGTVIR